MSRLRCLLLIPLLLGRCAAPETVFLEPEPEPTLPTVGEVVLLESEELPAEYLLLDIGIEVFDNIINPEDYQVFGEWVFEEIRENEIHYLPYVLRQTLLESNQWGAVRVLPQPDPAVDITLSGTVLNSDGQRLEMQVKAVDSSGRVWLDKTYADEAKDQDYPAQRRYTPGNPFDPSEFSEPFSDLYEQIANDLVEARAWLSQEELVGVRQISNLRYASDLSPESFGHMLATDELGQVSVVALPAEGDPMMDRVADMRLRHNVFIDTVDDYYGALYEEMKPSYVLWRRYSHDQQEETAAMIERFDPRAYGNSRSYLALTQRYDRYRWSKIFEQEFRSLAEGFNRELAPAILELNQQVHGLSGTMEEQYIQWRRTLRQIFALESGLEPSDIAN